MQILKDGRLSASASYFAVAALVVSLASLHVLVLHRQEFADDLYFSTALDQRNLWDFLSFRYSRWTGRIPLELLLVFVVDHVWLWKVLNVSMFVLLSYSIAVIAAGKRPVTGVGVALTACLVLLVVPYVIWWAAWWLTGSVNYLWPTALAAYALSVYLQPGVDRRWQKVAATICASFAAYSEQVAIVLLALGIVTLAWRAVRGTARTWDYVFVVAVLLNAAIALAAPGNANRFEAEQATWFPDFGGLGFADKLNIGVGLVSEMLLAPGNWLMLLAAVLGGFALARSALSGPGRWCVFPGLLWIVFWQLVGFAGYEAGWRGGFPLSAESASRPIVYAAMAASAYSFACLVSAAGAPPASRSGLREPLLALALLVGGGTLLLLGWSPTSTASGGRTAFVFMMVTVVVVADLLSRLEEDPGKGLRNIHRAICAAIVVGALIRMHALLTAG